MRTVRIFISSPGDVAEERQRAQEVIGQLQARYRGRFRLVPVLWEDLPLGAGQSFQEGIDLVVSEGQGIDIAVFILWSRLGSPLGSRILRADGNEYRSGTEREFDLMVQAHERSGGQRPALLAYVRQDSDGFIDRQKRLPLDDVERMLQQRRRLDDFIREQFHDPERGTNIRAYHSFDQPTGFAQRLRVHLKGLLDGWLADARGEEVIWDVSERGSPYRGLEAFGEAHREVFFGREEEVAAVQQRLTEQAAAGAPFVLLLGGSGSGKSSLVRAGVMPTLAEHQVDGSIREWRTVTYLPSRHGPDLLAGLVATLTGADGVPELAPEAGRRAALAEGLRRDPRLTCQLALTTVLRAADPAAGERRLFLLIDQLEEVFTLEGVSAAERAAFGLALRALLETGAVWMVATLRSDFYGAFQADPVLRELRGEHGQMDVLPPRRSQLHRIIAAPASLAGLEFERDAVTGRRLDEALLEDSEAQGEALPLLQFALDALYRRQEERRDRVLAWADYSALGGLEGAIAAQAEATLATLPTSERAEVLEGVFSQLLATTGGEQSGAIRRVASLQEVVTAAGPAREAASRALVEAFVRARLLVLTAEEGEERVGVAHEALLRRWPPLVDLRQRRADFFRIRDQLERAEADWRSNERNDSLLLAEGLPLELGRRLRAGAPDLLRGELRTYVERSLEVRTSEARRRQRTRRLVLASLSGLAAVAVVAGIVATGQARQARQAATVATAAQAEAEQERDRADGAARLAEQRQREALRANYRLYLDKVALARQGGREEEAVLWRRTAIDTGRELGLDVSRDELALDWQLTQLSGPDWMTPAGGPRQVQRPVSSRDGQNLWAMQYLSGRNEWALLHGQAGSDGTWQFGEPALGLSQIATAVPWTLGDSLLVAADSGEIWRVGLASGEVEVLELPGAGQPAMACPEGTNRLYVVRDGELRWLDLTTGRLDERRWPLGEAEGTPFFTLVVSPEQRWATINFSRAGQRRLAVWDLVTGRKVLDREREPGTFANLWGGYRGGFWATAASILWWDHRGGDEPPRIRETKLPWGTIQTVKVDEAAGLIWLLHADGGLRQWTWEGELVERTLTVDGELPGALAVADGWWLFSSQGVEHRAHDGTVLAASPSAPPAVALNPAAHDGSWLVASATGVELWDGQRGDRLRSWPRQAQQVAGPAPDGTLWAVRDLRLQRWAPAGDVAAEAADAVLNLAPVVTDDGIYAATAEGVYRFDRDTMVRRERVWAGAAVWLSAEQGGLLMGRAHTALGRVDVHRYDFSTGRTAGPWALPVRLEDVEAWGKMPGTREIWLGRKDGDVWLAALPDDEATESGAVVELVAEPLEANGAAVRAVARLAGGHLLVARHGGSLERWHGDPASGWERLETVALMRSPEGAVQLWPSGDDAVLWRGANGAVGRWRFSRRTTQVALPATLRADAPRRHGANGYFVYAEGGEVRVATPGGEWRLMPTTLSGLDTHRLAISPAGRHVVAGTQSGQVMGWTLAGTAPTTRPQSWAQAVLSNISVLEFVHETTLLAGHGDRFALLDLGGEAGARLRRSERLDGAPWPTAGVITGDWASWLQGDRLHRFDLASATTAASVRLAGSAAALVSDRDGQHVWVGGSGRVERVHVGRGEVVEAVELEAKGPDGRRFWVRALAVDPAGRWLLAGGDRAVVLVRREDGQMLTYPREDNITELTASADGFYWSGETRRGWGPWPRGQTLPTLSELEAATGWTLREGLLERQPTTLTVRPR